LFFILVRRAHHHITAAHRLVGVVVVIRIVITRSADPHAGVGTWQRADEEAIGHAHREVAGAIGPVPVAIVIVVMRAVPGIVTIAHRQTVDHLHRTTRAVIPITLPPDIATIVAVAVGVGVAAPVAVAVAVAITVA